ncbi:hypothetical protein [Bowmanella denitrificans]|uniref:hypothetical protein n=1 Tax=Bowmanella denitrificans TaxID=366582 RepID=UPI0011AEF6C1|nr:hypothetical protein [Bowmanella denitrificans]
MINRQLNLAYQQQMQLMESNQEQSRSMDEIREDLKLINDQIKIAQSYARVFEQTNSLLVRVISDFNVTLKSDAVNQQLGMINETLAELESANRSLNRHQNLTSHTQPR